MYHSQTVVALVPIKEHSERVAAKNFRDFCGSPLYHHIIRTLDRTYAIDTIVVNTDSPRVILEAPKLSAKVVVHERPAELCGDGVSTNRLFAHDLQLAPADIYVQTHATNPLLKPDSIARAIRTYWENRESHDSLFGVTVHHSRFYDQNCKAINHDPDTLLRTQDLPPVYEENSCLYVFSAEAFARRGGRIGLTPLPFEIPRIEAVDIDDDMGFRLAEILALYAGTAE